jgi:hypothetical protein
MRSAAPLVLALVLAPACASDEPMAAASSTTGSTGEPGTSEHSSTAPLDCSAAPSDLFTQRIGPLLASDRPKTCNTCHLSGVDLQMFVQETPCQTMACLEMRGLVDLADPQRSTILQWIARADPDSPLIDPQVIDEEYAAFLAWIEASAACGLCYTGDTPCGEPVAATCPADDPEADGFVDPGDCAPLTRETLFRHKVYAWRDRCYPCHFDNKEAEAPKWLATGSCELGSLTTMRNVLDGGLVDLKNPGASLLLRKPLAESAGGVMHGGHDKFADVNDPAYVDFLAWIEREAACTP